MWFATASGQQGLAADLRVRRAQTMSRPRLAYITHIARGDSTASSAAGIRRMRSNFVSCSQVGVQNFRSQKLLISFVQEGRGDMD